MDNDDRSLVDRLVTIENKQDEFLNTLNQVFKINQSSIDVNSQKKYEKEILSHFIKVATKDYLWFGSRADFYKSKRLVMITCISIFVLGVISTILTSIVFGIYSTFTLFENIIIFEAFFILIHAYSSNKITSDIDLVDYHCNKFELNVDNAWCSTGKEKKVYKVFRIISYISVIANIIIIWTQSKGGIAVVATIFEGLFLVATITNHFLNESFYYGYDHYVIITGRNQSNTETVKFVYDMIFRKFFVYEDFEEKFKLFIDG